jgi:hypothetical protein
MDTLLTERVCDLAHLASVQAGSHLRESARSRRPLRSPYVHGAVVEYRDQTVPSHGGQLTRLPWPRDIRCLRLASFERRARAPTSGRLHACGAHAALRRELLRISGQAPATVSPAPGTRMGRYCGASYKPLVEAMPADEWPNDLDPGRRLGGICDLGTAVRSGSASTAPGAPGGHDHPGHQPRPAT